MSVPDPTRAPESRVEPLVRSLIEPSLKLAFQIALDEICRRSGAQSGAIVRFESEYNSENLWTTGFLDEALPFPVGRLLQVARTFDEADDAAAEFSLDDGTLLQSHCIFLTRGDEKSCVLCLAFASGTIPKNLTEDLHLWSSVLTARLHSVMELERSDSLRTQYERGFNTLDRQVRVLDLERQKLAAVLNNSEIGFLVVNRDLKVTWANPAMALQLNAAKSRFNVLNQSCHEVVCGQPEPCDHCPARKAHTCGDTGRSEINANYGGDKRRLYTTAVPIRGSKGEIKEVLLMVQDLTRMDALKRSELRYRLLFESSLDAIFMAGPPDYSIVMANPATLNLLGYDSDEIASVSLPDIHGEDEWPRMKVLYDRALAGEQVRSEDSLVLDRDGGQLTCNLIALPFDLEGVEVIMCNLRDMSARKKDERSLQYRLRFENLISTLSSHFINLSVSDIDEGIHHALQSIGTFANADRCYIVLFNRKFGEFSMTHEWCAPGIKSQMQRIVEIPTDALPWFVKHIRNHNVVQLSRVEDLPASAKEEQMEFEIRELKSIVAVPMVYGKSLLGFMGFDAVTMARTWNSDEVSLLHIASELLSNALARKRADSEKQSLEDQLRQSQKMEAVGTLAGGIAHDFNNLLTGILGYADMLTIGGLNETQTKKAAEVIERAARRAADLTQQLLGFARKGKYQNIPVDLHAIIHEVSSLLGRTLDKNISIRLNLAAIDPFVLGDPVQIQQVILNLSVNARDAMGEGGTLAFETERVSVPGGPNQGGDDDTLQDCLRLSVSDTGCGMSEVVQSRVFEPFFTTKEQGKGTGMGLSMVYGIVKNHGGSISVTSQTGEGTRFDILLPATERPALVVKSEPELAISEAHELILLVDDEPMVRGVATAMLEKLGYRVIAAADGIEALEVYQNRGPEIDLVILDMVMPRMGGKDCFRRLKEADPEVRVILSTGYTLDDSTRGLLREGIVGFAQKPYVLRQISRYVLDALDPTSA